MPWNIFKCKLKREFFFPVGALSPVGDLIGWLAFLLLCYSLNGWQPRGRPQLASSISSLAKCLEKRPGRRIQGLLWIFFLFYYCAKLYH